MKKLSAKEQKLLLALFADGRASNTQLAKKAGMSKELVGYHLAKLSKEEILQGVIPVVNYNSIGYRLYRLQLKFLSVTPKKEAEHLDFIRKLPSISWIVDVDGPWDLVLLFLISNEQEYYDVQEKIMQKLGADIEEKQFTIVTAIHHFPPNYLLGGNRQMYRAHKSYVQYELSNQEKEILKYLMDDGRMSLVELSKNIGLSVTTVNYHLKNLLKKEIISEFRPVLDLAKLGYEHFKVMLLLHDPSQKRECFETLQNNPNVVYITESLGNFDLEFEAEFAQVNPLLSFLSSMKSKIPLKKYEIVFTNKELLVNSFPKERRDAE